MLLHTHLEIILSMKLMNLYTQGILGGWFKHENGQIVEIPELKPVPESYNEVLERVQAVGCQI